MDAQISAPDVLDESSPSPPSPPLSPYVGPRPFRRGERLYGRQRAGRQLLDLLIAERIVLLYSPSGAGKTSLVQAQIIPALEGEGFRVLPTLRVNEDAEFDASSGDNRYLESLKRSLAAGVAEAIGVGPLPLALAEPADVPFTNYLNTVSENLPAGLITKGATTESVNQNVNGNADGKANGGDATYARRFDGEVLIFDQFEEILTLDPTDYERKAEFFTEVGLALRDRRRWAIFVMREEFLAGLDPYLRALPTRLTNPYRLELLPVESALAAIQQPAERVGVTFTDAAAQRLVDDLRRVRVQRPDGSTTEQLGQFVEPVQLQVVCDRLWQSAQPTANDPIDVDDIDALGSIDDALADYYADTVAHVAQQAVVDETLTDRQSLAETKSAGSRMLADKRKVEAVERQIREWFGNELITEQGIRGLVLQGAEESAGLSNELIYKLGAAHLVRAEERRGVTWFELAHDRLVEPVRRSNERWRNQTLSVLQRQAQLWEAENRPRSLLLTGRTLRAAERWAQSHEAQMTETERQFLEASIAPRRQRQLFWGLGIGLAILLLVGLLGWLSQQGVIEQSANALLNAQDISQSRRLASEAQSIRAQQVDVALLLGLHALQESDTVEARSSLFDALGEASLLETYVARGVGGSSGVADATFSADGQTLIVGGDRSIFFYDPATGAQLRSPLEHPQPTLDVLAVGGAPGAELLVTGGSNRPNLSQSTTTSVSLWDLSETSPRPRPFDTRPDDRGIRIRKIWLSPDGLTLAVLGDSLLRVWRLAPSRLEAESELLLEQENVETMALSQTGERSRLAVSRTDRALVVSEIDGSAPITLTQPITDRRDVQTPLASELAFDQTGRRLGTATRNGAVTLWEVDTRRALPVASQSERSTWRLAFASDPQGSDLLIVSGAQTIRLWRLAASQPLLDQTLRKHTDAIQTLAVAPDGSGRFASGDGDGRVLLWNLAQTQQLGEVVAQKIDETEALAISPDGRWLADGGGNATITVRDVSTGTTAGLTLSAPLPDSLNFVRSLDFHPDASRALLAVGDESGYITLWHVRDAASESTTSDSTIEAGLDLVWSSRAHGESTSVNRVVFDPIPAHNRLISGGSDGQVLLWTLPPTLAPTATVTQSLLLQTEQEFYGVFDVEFSDDGEQVAVASTREFVESQITLWDIQASELISVSQPLLYSVPVRSMDLHPNGRLLVAGYEEEAGRGDDDLAAANVSPTGQADGATLDETTQIFGQQAIIWNLQESKWERALSRHTGSVLATTFSPSGELLATASRDRTLILWTLDRLDVLDGRSWRALGQPIVAHKDEISAAVFAPDGRALYTAGYDQQILRWDIDVAVWRTRACAIANRSLNANERRVYQIDAEAGAVCDGVQP